VVAFITSAGAAYVTGQALTVDGRGGANAREAGKNLVQFMDKN
jgi:hypothetical protein